MKRPLHVPLLTCGAILLAMFTTSVASGQATVQFRLEQVPIPEGFFVNDFNNQNLVVGHSRFTDGATVVLYDHDGVLGASRSTWSLDDLIDLPAEFSSTSILDINDSGQFVAYLKRDDGTRESILVDLFDLSGSLSPTWRYLAVPTSNSLSYASRLNDFGLVAGTFESNVTGERNVFLLDATDPEADPQVLNDPTTGLPIALTAPELLRLNNLGHVSGNILTGGISGAYYVSQGFRITPGIEMLLTPLDVTIRSAYIRDMNDVGEIAGEAQVAVTGSGRKRKTTLSWRGIRFDDQGYDFFPLTSEARSWNINNSGDVLGTIVTYDGSRESQFLVHDSNLIYLDEVVTGDQDDVNFWLASTNFGKGEMNDRDAMGYGQVFIRTKLPSLPGKAESK